MLYLDPGKIPSSEFPSIVDNSSWPVSDSEYRAFVDHLINDYIVLIEDSDNEIADILAADSRFLYTLIDTLHYNCASARYHRSGGFSPALEHGTLFGNLFTTSPTRLAPYYNVHRTIHALARTAYTTFRKNIELKKRVFPFFGTAPLALSVGYADDHLRAEFLAARSCRIIWADDLPFFIASGTRWNSDMRKRVAPVVDRLLEILKRLPKDFTTSLPEERLRLYWIERFDKLLNVHSAVRSLTSSRLDEVHVFGAGNLCRKIFSLALMREGIPVFGYDHGNVFGGLIQRNAYLLEERYRTFSISPTSRIAKNIFHNYKAMNTSRHFPEPSFCSSKSTFYKNLIHSNDSKLFSMRRNRILIMGYALTRNRQIDGVAEFYYYRLPLENSIARDLLLCNSYEITYKMHPDCNRENYSTYLQSLGVEIDTRPFEIAYQDYDQYVFTTIASTTFGFSLTTNRPITLLLHQEELIPDDMKTSLRSRVSIVEMTWSTPSRLHYSSDDLLESVARGGAQIVRSDFVLDLFT